MREGKAHKISNQEIPEESDPSRAHPLGIAAGSALFWSLPVVPPWWLMVISLGVGVWARFWLRGLVLCVCLGFSAAYTRTLLCQGVPQLDYPIAVGIEGQVLQVHQDSSSGACRLSIKITAVDNTAPSWALLEGATVVVKVHQEEYVLNPGDRLGLDVRLYPLSTQQRFSAYFEGISARGSGELRSKISANPSGLWGWFQRLRTSLNTFFSRVLPNQEAAIACALVTGHKGLLSSETQEAFRRSGLSHLLAISGLHMSLVMGLFFFFFRRVLVVIYPAYVLYVSPRRTAASLAWIGGAIYVMVAGGAFPVQRAFMMATLALWGLMIYRDAVGLRLLTSVASLTLMLFPEAVFSISFQLSFGAVMGLMAAQRSAKRIETYLVPPTSLLNPLTQRLIRWASGSLISSSAACWGTLPCIWIQFHALQLQGFVANAIAIPYVAVCVMPLLVISVLFQGINQEAWVGQESWLACGLTHSLSGFRWIAQEAAGLPGSLTLPPVPGWLYGLCGLGCLAWGLGWPTLRWGKISLRSLGLSVMMASVIVAPWCRTLLKPQLLVSPSLIGLYLPQSHTLLTSKAFTSRPTVAAWLRAWGNPQHVTMPFTGRSKDFVCSKGTCRINVQDLRLILWNQGDFQKDISNTQGLEKVDMVVTTSRRSLSKKRFHTTSRASKRRRLKDPVTFSKLIRSWRVVPWGWKSFPLTADLSEETMKASQQLALVQRIKEL